MRLIIHRGTHEIGGSCVELQIAKTRILIDFGMPLVDENRKPFDQKSLLSKSIAQLKESKILPNVKGLYKDEPKGVDAILISHSHMDHYGLLNYINPDIPIYMSKGAKKLIEISNIFTPNKIGAIIIRIIKDKPALTIGEFTITPYLVDHSAFDARAFLIEGEGKRVFYSGDFRGHGRKSVLFKNMVDNPPTGIDCLLMEGTMLGRSRQAYKDENDIQTRIEGILKKNTGITFLFASSQNVDRLVSAYKACRATDSIFIIDIYTAFILNKLKAVADNIPQFNWKNIRIKFLTQHMAALIKAGYEDLLRTYAERGISIKEINERKNKMLMIARDNSVFPLIINKIKDLKGTKIIYSMWEGYLNDKFRKYCKDKGLEIEIVHTSGHAPIEDLKRLAKAINPSQYIIPIHTEMPEKFREYFGDKVMLVSDGQQIRL